MQKQKVIKITLHLLEQIQLELFINMILQKDNIIKKLLENMLEQLIMLYIQLLRLQEINYILNIIVKTEMVIYTEQKNLKHIILNQENLI